MEDTKAGVAIFVKSKVRTGREPWRESYLFGGRFENIADSLNYLQFLENKNSEFIVQIGFVGWGRR